jgi:hypothetical protein
LAADAHFEAAEAHVVLDHAARDGAEVERQRPLDADAADLAIEVDLGGGAEPALEELLEAQQFLVSSSTLQLDLDEREVRRGRLDLDAGRQAGGERQGGEERGQQRWLHGQVDGDGQKR